MRRQRPVGCTRGERVLDIVIGITFAFAVVLAVVKLREAFLHPPAIQPGVLTRMDDWRDFGAEGIRLGAADGTVTIVAFLDVQCAICARASPWLMGQLSDSSTSVVVRHFPRDSVSFEGAVALECAHVQDHFVDLLTAVFDRRTEIDDTRWIDFAQGAGLPNVDRFARCMRSGEARARVRADTLAAAGLGVPGTPTFVVNDMLVAGFGGATYMERIVRAARTSRTPR